mgnify:FL=1
MSKENIIESLKECGRVIVLAIIPILINALSSGKFDLRIILVTGAIAGLKFIDKLLHNMGKEIEEDTGEESAFTKGITRF